MSTDPCRLRDRSGAALVSAVVAMLILSIGMVGLITAGAGAARSVAFAEWHTNATALAMRYLENAQRELADHSVESSRRPQARCETVGPDQVSVQIDLSVPRIPRTTVTVRRSSGEPANRIATLTTDAFFDVPLTGPVQGAPCS